MLPRSDFECVLSRRHPLDDVVAQVSKVCWRFVATTLSSSTMRIRSAPRDLAEIVRGVVLCRG